MSKPKSKKPKADRHLLYQQSVQDVESEIDFVQDTFAQLRDHRPVWLREDFCGTANTACEWIRRRRNHKAQGIDLDAAVLEWGQAHNVGKLTPAQRRRIELVEADVRIASDQSMDIVLAMNFSYFLFLERAAMREYFASVHASLDADGLFFLDAYGGYDAPREIVEPRDCGHFTYIWEQASFNPINSQMQCHIHFELADGTRMERAFSYYWRLWTLPEIRELLAEAGFACSRIYWEGTDEESNEGNGEFTESEVGDADPGWICYIVAEP